MLIDLFKALADPTRLRLVAILDRGEFTVQELVSVLDMGQSRVSRHLKILHDAGIVGVKREGTWAYYRLEPNNDNVSSQITLLRPRLSEIDGFERDGAGLASIMAHRRQRSQQFFDSHAQQWDRIARDLLPTPDYRNRLLSRIPDSGLLVEIGVGTGGLLVALSDKAEQVIGIDHSPAMLDSARARVDEDNLENIELRLGEMEHLPLESKTVDVIVLQMVLHHAPSPEKVMLEVKRVLRPGGIVLVADLERHEAEWARERLADQWLGFTSTELDAWCEKAELSVEDCLRVSGEKDGYPVLILQARKT
jgi:ArsR family transcriptional regulator